MLSLSGTDMEVRADFDDARPLFVRPEAPRVRGSIGAGTIASIAFHVVVVGIAVGMTSLIKPKTPPRPLFAPVRLASIVYLPSTPIEVPRFELAPVPAPRAVETPEPKPELPIETPTRPVEVEAPKTPAPARVVASPEPPRPAPITPAPPTPTVGLFKDAATAARAPEPVRQVENAGFDAPVKQTVESKLGQATVGAFDQATTSGQRQSGAATPTGAVVADSGFGRPSSAAPPTQQSRVIRESGFGASPSLERPKSAAPAEVKDAGFANAAPAQNSRAASAAPPPPVVTPVEVLFKPAPTYTEQARKLRIEGDVVLEVEFLSSGTLRVIRVVRGLGHGLDEAAVKAAEQIRFKPAQSSGRAVDSRNTVSIVFRLA